MNRKQHLLLLIFCFFLVPAYSQEDRIDSLLNVLLFEDDDFMEIVGSSSKYQFIYSRVSYDTKTFFAGRDIGLDQYNMTGQLSWFHSSGINLGAVAVYYSAMDPKISTFLLMAGYNGRFSKSPDYRFRVSYNRFFFPSGGSFSSANFNGSLTTGITVDKKIAGTRIDYSLLMGKEYASQVSWDIYGDFNVLKLGKFDRIKFEPEVSFYAGTDQTIISRVGILPGLFPRGNKVTNVETVKFGWMNTELKLPITISYRSFDFEIGYKLNFPHSLVSEEKPERTSCFNFSIGYIISL